MGEQDVLSRFTMEIEQRKRLGWNLQSLDSEQLVAVFTQRSRPSQSLGRGRFRRAGSSRRYRLTLWVNESGEIQSRQEDMSKPAQGQAVDE